MMDLSIYCLLFFFVRGDDVIVGRKNNGDITFKSSNPYHHPYCQWQRESSPGQFEDLTDREKDKYKNRVTAKMTIKSFNFADRGSYRCKCYDDTKYYRYSSSITIDIADVRTEKRLYCGHTGTYYKWERNSRIINDNRQYSNTTSKVLTLLNVHWNEDGIYRCEYHNNGWQPVDFYLVVQDIKLPMIYLPRSPYVAVVGDDILLKCTFGQTIPKTTAVWWTKFNNGHYKNFAGSDEKKNQGGAIQSLSLKISSVIESDSGEYRCNGQNTNGQKFLATQLIIGNKPQPPATKKPTINVREGMEVTLSCTPPFSKTNLTSLWWGKKWYGEKFQSINYDYKYKYSGGNLSIPNLTIKKVYLQDATDYRCNVANIFGTSYVDTKVVIGSSPTVRVHKRIYNPVRGDPISLDCYFRNAEKVWWKRVKNGQEETVDTARTSGKLTQSLTIQNVDKQDDGDYRCYGSNDISTASGTITVLSGYPPVVNIRQDCYVLRVGDNVRIDVTVKNAPPGSTIKWRQGINYKYNSIRRTIGELSNPFLIIRNVELKDAGNYTLYVQNTYGNHSSFTVLKVISATIRGNKGYRKLTKTANDSLTIECEVSGGTTVTWRLNGKQLEGVYQLSLRINKITRLDKGNYTCETSLETVTAKSSILQLDVKDIPLVTTTRKKVEVNKGIDIVLPCFHDSYPTPTNVYWTRNGVNIYAYRTTKYNGSTIGFASLVIHDTGQTDSGTYVCAVSNNIGTGYSKPLQLLIIGPAKQTSLAEAVAGIVAIVVVVILIVIFIWRRRRLSYESNRKPTSGTTKRSTDKVSMHRGRGDSAIGLHFNVKPLSSEAADDGKLSTKPVVAADAEYYNVSDVTSTCFRVEDLKNYIQKRQRHEQLKNEYKSIPKVAEHPTTHAQSKDNMPKNRFKTTFPYDHTRVILKSGGESDYINANYIDGFEKERCYIACQGPIKTTVGDHWKMIWQENIDQIVMLTNLVEGIKNKCEQYWPSGGKQMVFGNLIIHLNVEKERTAYVTREITIEDKKSGKKRKVTQYHFTAWPDHGTPDPLYLVLFHRHVISDTKAGHSGPLLVHCSAGIGRTGTYIALDALLEEGRTTKFLDIFKFLKKMRYSRMNMIQTSDQYVCLHYALLEAFTMKETKIRKDVFSEVWQSILTDHRPLNQQRLNKEFKELQQHVGEIKGLSSSMLNATKNDQNQNQYNAAMSTTNLAKHRNKDVLPMDDKRVFLVSYGNGRSDYINAVQVPSYTKFIGYITTQLPLPDTKVDFWTMIRDHNSSTIVLIINNAKEADLVYSQSGDTFTVGQFSIKISTREEGKNNIKKATMVLSKKDDKPRQVVLLQVVCNKIPDPLVLCKLADLISTRATMSDDPITVVSSDGAKNCGLFCAFTSAVSSMQIDHNADIFQLVRLLQLRRPEFFTDFEEYKRCYEALHVHLESANVYANF